MSDILEILNNYKYQEYLDSNNTRWETLRESYRPSKIKTLIVGEAPPNGGTRFFYYDDVPNYDNLFLAIMSVLYPTDTKAYLYKRTSTVKKELLNRFKEQGFYLMDLYPMPLDQKPKGKGEKFFRDIFLRKLKENQLAHNCKIILLNPARILELPLKLMGYEVYILPFPSTFNKGRDKFKALFWKIIAT